ncbi:hypothetical protein RBSWK_04012 [Rhodopirellula baltica SWK14]|uniref:Uncharacterized protein n=1 Tax=Rhodopirellula baltica SWK14 TaxID=993516 RepID=L7CCX1_RHOBT|nr:hypothetical protein RBSWK_04012 [Rhodopirellula baltica SWK14]
MAVRRAANGGELDSASNRSALLYTGSIVEPNAGTLHGLLSV